MRLKEVSDFVLVFNETYEGDNSEGYRKKKLRGWDDDGRGQVDRSTA